MYFKRLHPALQTPTIDIKLQAGGKLKILKSDYTFSITRHPKEIMGFVESVPPVWKSGQNYLQSRGVLESSLPGRSIFKYELLNVSSERYLEKLKIMDNKKEHLELWIPKEPWLIGLPKGHSGRAKVRILNSKNEVVHYIGDFTDPDLSSSEITSLEDSVLYGKLKSSGGFLSIFEQDKPEN